MIENLRHIDRLLFHFINHDLANSTLDILCPWLREKLTWIPFYVAVAYLIFRKYGAKKTLLLIALGAATILISDQTSGVFKHFVHRLRPCNNPEMNVRLMIESCGVGYSFVSAHAANHFAIATFISFLVNRNKLLITLLYIWAAAVALSQVYVGVHYPADIIAGAVVGIVAGFITGSIAKRFVIFESIKKIARRHGVEQPRNTFLVLVLYSSVFLLRASVRNSFLGNFSHSLHSPLRALRSLR